jgi:hypothetical protein
LERLGDQLSGEDVRNASGLLGLIALLLGFRAYFRARAIRNALIDVHGLLAIGALLTASAIFVTHSLAMSSPPAISTLRQGIRSGPGDHFLELSQAEVGQKFRLLGPMSTASTKSSQIQGDPAQSSPAQSELWRQVRYSAEGVGWVKDSGLLKVN